MGVDSNLVQRAALVYVQLSRRATAEKGAIFHRPSGSTKDSPVLLHAIYSSP